MSRLLLAVLASIGVASAAIPDYLIPVSYDLAFNLNLDDKDNGFLGSNVIHFNTAKKLDKGITTIVFNSLGLKITKAELHYPDQKYLLIKKIDYNTTEETVSLKIDQQLEPNSPYTLNLHYTGLLNGTEGLFIVSDNENYLEMNSYPVYARRIYPCLDKPNLRAKYTINLEVHYTRKNDPTIITGLSGSFKAYKKDYKYFKPQTKYLQGTYNSDIDLPPYGFFFTVGSYKEAKKNYPVYIPDQEKYSNIIKQDVMDVLLTTVAQDLVKKTGVNEVLVVVPDMPVSSVSAYGIAAVSTDVATEYPDYSTDTLRTQSLELLKAAVKSFFTTVVSPISWENVWIAESVSTYIAHAALNQMTTTWKNWPNIEILALQQYALSNTWSASSSPVIPTSLNTSENIVKFISDPAIIKGAAILGMLETLAVKPLTTFSEFVTKFKGKAVSTDDLLNFYEKLNIMNHTLPDGTSLRKVVSPWLLHTGYPYISVSRNDHLVQVNKKQFGQETNGNQGSWMLPLSYKTVYLNYTNSSTINALSDEQFVWLDDQQNGNYTVVKDPLHNLLVFFDIRGPGLYRVLYDKSSLEFITKKLQDDVNFLPSEFLRSTLISDNFAFAQKGLLPYTSLFDTLNYMTSERSLGPWTIASDRLREFWSLIYPSDLRLAFQNYVQKLMRPGFLHYSIDVGNADMVMGLIRKYLINGMCDYGDEACRKMTKDAYNTYIVGKKSIADADIIDVLYCNGLRDVTDGNQIQQMFKERYTPNLPEYKKKSLFYYLSCSGGEMLKSGPIMNLLDNFLVSPDQNTMPAEDMILGFKEIASKPQHYEEALTYFTENYGQIRATMDDKQRADLIEYLGTLGSTEDHLTVLGNFTFSNSSRIILNAVQDAIKSIQSRMQFLNNHYNDIYQGLYGYTPSTDTTPSNPPDTSPTKPSNTTSTEPTPKSASPASANLVPMVLAFCIIFSRYLA